MSLEVSSQFNLPTSINALPSINNGNPLLSNILEVNPMRNCAGANFATGPIKFQWAIPSNERGKLDESYFRVRMSLWASNATGNAWVAPTKSFKSYLATGAVGNTGIMGGAGSLPIAFPSSELQVPISGDDVSFCENPVASLFNMINFKVGGQIVSEVQSYQPQIDTAVRRLTESFVSQTASKWRDLFGTTLRERIDLVSSNSVPRPPVYNAIDTATPTALVFTANEGNNSIANDYTNRISNLACVNEPSTAPFNSNSIELLWKPRSLGAFSTGVYLPVGNYELELLPFSTYAFNCIESIRNILPAQLKPVGQAPTAGAGPQYQVRIDDFRFFIPTCASEKYYSDLNYYLSLTEYQIQVKPLSANQNIMNLVVPWSTQTFAFMLQTSSVGYQSLVPVNKFLNIRTPDNAQNANAIIDENSNDLRNLQINYGKVYPKTLYDTGLNRFVGGENGSIFGRQNIYQRYEDTYNNCQSNLEVGQQEPFMSSDKQILTYTPRVAGGNDVAVANAGDESITYVNPTIGFSTCDFLSRGLISCISVAKDSSAKNTDLTVNIQYNSTKNAPTQAGNNGQGLCMAGNPNLLVMSVYKKTAHIVIQQGATVSVESTLG